MITKLTLALISGVNAMHKGLDPSNAVILLTATLIAIFSIAIVLSLLESWNTGSLKNNDVNEVKRIEREMHNLCSQVSSVLKAVPSENDPEIFLEVKFSRLFEKMEYLNNGKAKIRILWIDGENESVAVRDCEKIRGIGISPEKLKGGGKYYAKLRARYENESIGEIEFEKVKDGKE